MKLLLLGGSIFLGRHIVEMALARGHEVTTFTRGRHDDVLPEQVERLHGDRDGNLQALEGRKWDAAIDTSGYVPRVVRAGAEMLARAVEHYTFISSISVYTDEPVKRVTGVGEDYPVGKLADESVEEITGETYGPLKALCEQAVQQVMVEKVLVIRPGLIVGPYDPTDRFTYWPYRIGLGGDVLAPDRKDVPVQIIDVRNLAQWVIHMVEARQTGTYNATGPAYPLRLESFLKLCQELQGSESTFTWVSEEFLAENNVEPWTELPLWIPRAMAADLFSADIHKAIAAGLTFHPLSETIRNTLEWNATLPADREWRAGLKAERERELLELWYKQPKDG